MWGTKAFAEPGFIVRNDSLALMWPFLSAEIFLVSPFGVVWHHWWCPGSALVRADAFAVPHPSVSISSPGWAVYGDHSETAGSELSLWYVTS